jgi:cytochrome c-type biogenesis protein CcmH
MSAAARRRGLRAPRTPRTPLAPRVTGAPRTPRMPRTPGAPRTPLAPRATGAPHTLLALALALLALVPAAAAAAPAPQPRTTLPAIEQQVMCVVCRTPLAVANGPQADAERQQIRTLIAQGKSAQQVKDALVAQYGTRVLALPPSGGFDLAVYLVPIALVAAALALLALLLPRWRRRARARAAQPALATPALSAEDARRLDEDLARHD